MVFLLWQKDGDASTIRFGVADVQAGGGAINQLQGVVEVA